MDLAFSIEPFDFGRDIEPELRGYLVVWPLDDGDVEAILYVRPGSQIANIESVREDCFERIERLLKVGPIADGWHKRESDSGWQTWLREHPTAG